MLDIDTVSILIPTLNASRTLEACLRSIFKQDYPSDKIEVIITDAGSTDETLKIVDEFIIHNSEFKIQVISNALKTAEAGKAIALKKSRGDLIALIDSDNILPDKNWLKRMTRPFSDPQIVASEPWQFTYRRQDGFIDRYCALIGMNDPLVMFLGNYDRLNLLTGKWTELEIEQTDHGFYRTIDLLPGLLPTLGANGTLIRSKVLQDWRDRDYFFDIDVIYGLTQRKTLPVRKFAKVKTGIIHLYSGANIFRFIHKQRRRIKDYLYYESLGARHYPWRMFGWQTLRGRGLILFIFSCLTILPLIWQASRGYQKKKDASWFFHPLACWLTLLIYGYYWLKKTFLK